MTTTHLSEGIAAGLRAVGINAHAEPITGALSIFPTDDLSISTGFTGWAYGSVSKLEKGFFQPLYEQVDTGLPEDCTDLEALIREWTRVVRETQASTSGGVIDYLIDYLDDSAYYIGPLAPATRVIEGDGVTVRLIPRGNFYRVVILHPVQNGERPDSEADLGTWGDGPTPEIAARYAFGAYFGPRDDEYDPAILARLIAAEIDANTETKEV